nr:hypothetical protein [Tanacetum cinerariifolium]
AAAGSSISITRLAVTVRRGTSWAARGRHPVFWSTRSPIHGGREHSLVHPKKAVVPVFERVQRLGIALGGSQASSLGTGREDLKIRTTLSSGHQIRLNFCINMLKAENA